MASKKRNKATRKSGQNTTVLRDKAEAVLTSQSKPAILPTKKKNPDQLVHELQVYQVELEMQNDELRRSQEALEEERGRFAAIFNFAPLGFFVLDPATVIQECNEMGLNLFEATRTMLIGKRFISFISSESSDQFYLFIKKLLSSGKTEHTLLPFVGAGARKFYGQVQGCVVKNSIGTNLSYYITIIDITEKHVSDLKLQEATERLQIALKGSLSGTMTIDLKSGVVHPDDFVLNLFAIGVNAFDGRLASLYKYIIAEDVNKIDPKIRKALSETGHLNEIFRVANPVGEIRYLQIQGKTVSIESHKNIFISLITDVTKRENQRIHADLMTQRQQSEMLRTVLRTQEEERLRISQALHDSLAQLLYAATLKLQNSEAINDVYFTKASSLLHQAIKETRKISFELAPSILKDYGLTAALAEMASRISSKILTIEAKIAGLDNRLPLQMETDIFRILQELVNNIVKHSGATKGLIKINKSGSKVEILVQDNGKGFSLQAEATKNGTGLSSIRNRISLYNGTMKVKPPIGKGTTVTVELENITELPHVSN
jgi:PAS domain S-box-containing protein